MKVTPDGARCKCAKSNKIIAKLFLEAQSLYHFSSLNVALNLLVVANFDFKLISK